MSGVATLLGSRLMRRRANGQADRGGAMTTLAIMKARIAALLRLSSLPFLVSATRAHGGQPYYTQRSNTCNA